MSDKKVFGTPFAFKDGINTVLLSPDNIKCDVNKYRALRQKGRIGEADVAIMISLFVLKYATKHTLVQFIGVNFNTVKKNFDKNFKSLISFGLIQRYCFIYNGESAEGPIKKETTPFYCLSEYGYKVAKKLFKGFLKEDGREVVYSQFNTNLADLKLPVPILERLVINQFRASFLSSYRNLVVKEFYDIPIKHNKVYFDIPIFYKLKIENKIYGFCILAVRSNPNASKSLLNRLEGINLYSSAKKGVFSQNKPIYIVICENEKHVSEIELARLSNAGTSKLKVFYTTDVLAANDEILANIIKTEHAEHELTYKYLQFV